MPYFGLETAFKAIIDADSPESARLAYIRFREILADSFLDSADECEANWQDPSAGAPWRKLARDVRPRRK